MDGPRASAGSAGEPGLFQEGLAKRLGCSPSLISSYETGERSPACRIWESWRTASEWLPTICWDALRRNRDWISPGSPRSSGRRWRWSSGACAGRMMRIFREIKIPPCPGRTEEEKTAEPESAHIGQILAQEQPGDAGDQYRADCRAPTESRMPVPPVMPPMTPVRKDSR